MSTGKIILIVIVLFAFMCGGAFIGQFNEIRTLENGVQVSWANIEARSKMGGVIKMDDKILGDERAMKRFQEAQNSLGGALQRLMMVTENYPNLKANAAFRDLRVQLEGCENRIAESRRQFNTAVGQLNNKVRTFPGVLVAGFAGVTPKVPFAAADGANVAPTVKF